MCDRRFHTNDVQRKAVRCVMLWRRRCGRPGGVKTAGGSALQEAVRLQRGGSHLRPPADVCCRNPKLKTTSVFYLLHLNLSPSQSSCCPPPPTVSQQSPQLIFSSTLAPLSPSESPFPSSPKSQPVSSPSSHYSAVVLVAQLDSVKTLLQFSSSSQLACNDPPASLQDAVGSKSFKLLR